MRTSGAASLSTARSRDSDGCDGRAGISALPKGAGPVRSVEGGKWRPATRRTDAGRLRGGARPGNKQCRVRRSIQPTHSERALLIARRHGGTLGGLLIRKTRRDGPAVAEGSVIDTAWTYLNLPRQAASETVKSVNPQPELV